MCGPENTNRPRGGALVSLNSHSSKLSGDLAFHTPGSPSSSSATHARLTPNEECSINNFSNLHIIIHSSGDLTRNASECGLFRQFSLQSPTASNHFVESQLEGPLSLEVGGDGIIGRRVSVYSRLATGQNKIVAEGIVGFNFMSQGSSEESSCPSSPSPSL
ncbi:hypothetical protein FPOAC1_002192 [Fusarium poae]|jgi:hypothetical protein|uniref:hypothetical protein n=1 Tax=Fusarium poae TaxID=36050 RepID=UPI001CE8E6BE|nr:hypothetical protein FPOAC1_002192 [Fusarium poae]KAG8676191.1 hypothetical protein FPOAC1_002192 [Fusarium poae]